MIRHARRLVITVTAGLGLIAVNASAPALGDGAAVAPVLVTSYDVNSTPASGFGMWSHTYTGDITQTGRAVDGSVPGPVSLVDYSGGSGTLNDGLRGSIDATHLFTNRLDAAGQPIEPTIELHLPSPTYVDAIEVYGGDNSFAGLLTGGTVTVGTASEQIAGTPFGSDGYTDNNDRFQLTTLSALPTQAVRLSDILPGKWFGYYQLDQFTITEIVVIGRPAGPTATPVQIDVKPGDPLATINLAAHGNLPVALLSSATLDVVSGADPASLTFGVTGTEPSISGWRSDDVNRDGMSDLVLFVDVTKTGLRSGDSSVRLEGHLHSGGPIASSEAVRVISAP